MKTDRVNALEMFDNDEHADAALDESHQDIYVAQHERFRARFRDLANAMAEHPLSDQLTRSIERLRQIADGTYVKNR